MIEEFLRAKELGLRFAGAQGTPATLKAYGTSLRRAERLLHKPLAEFTEEDADRLLTVMHERELGQETINLNISALRSFFTWAIKSGRPVALRENAFLDLKTTHKGARKAPKYITEAQFLRVIEAIEQRAHAEEANARASATQGDNIPWVNDEGRVAKKTLPLKLMFYGGLRISEAVSIETDRITENGVIVTGKGDKERFVPLPDWLLAELSDYAAEFGGERYVFVPLISEKRRATLDEEPHLNTQAIHTVFRQGVQDANMPAWVTPHKLRHSFATQALSRTGRLDFVQKVLGHENPATTQIYAHFTDQDVLDLYGHVWDRPRQSA